MYGCLWNILIILNAKMYFEFEYLTVKNAQIKCYISQYVFNAMFYTYFKRGLPSIEQLCAISILVRYYQNVFKTVYMNTFISCCKESSNVLQIVTSKMMYIQLCMCQNMIFYIYRLILGYLSVFVLCAQCRVWLYFSGYRS